MTRRARGVAGALAAVVLATTAAAQHQPETLTATATVTRGEARASAPITITITQYSSAKDRAAVLAAIRAHGSAGARQTLSTLGDAGTIELGGRRTAIKFAGARPVSGGHLVTVVTAEPLLFLGAGLPESKARDGYDVAVAILNVREDGAGMGELAPAAKIGLDAEEALLINDYGATVVWLEGLTKAR
jgi:hypothetical protein